MTGIMAITSTLIATIPVAIGASSGTRCIPAGYATAGIVTVIS